MLQHLILQFLSIICQKLLFPEGIRGVHNTCTCGNSRGVGCYFCVQKMVMPGRRGAYVKFPLWWARGYLLEVHNYI